MSSVSKAQTDQPLLASIDAGGTTFKCALIKDGGGIAARLRVPTTTPAQTLDACAQFFQQHAKTGLTAKVMGVASFGPIDVDTESHDYGMIKEGPKSAWANINLKTYFEETLSIPVAVDTDVNGALLAEMAWGAAQGARTAAYVTIGTGIGAGLYANGGLIGKPSHPEFGHIRLQRHPADIDFRGICPVHGDCLEGLASAAALMDRFGSPADLPEDHIAWEIESFYLAQACNALALTLRPDRIVLGGGLMLAKHLLGKVRVQYAALINNYLSQSRADIETLIVTPGLGDDAGLYGGAYLAKTNL